MKRALDFGPVLFSYKMFFLRRLHLCCSRLSKPRRLHRIGVQFNRWCGAIKFETISIKLHKGTIMYILHTTFINQVSVSFEKLSYKWRDPVLRSIWRSHITIKVVYIVC